MRHPEAGAATLTVRLIFSRMFRAYGEGLLSRIQCDPICQFRDWRKNQPEGRTAPLCEAITGWFRSTDLFDENCKAEILSDVQADVKTDFDYQILGWCYPEKYKGLEVPVLKGLKKGRRRRAS